MGKGKNLFLINFVLILMIFWQSKLPAQTGSILHNNSSSNNIRATNTFNDDVQFLDKYGVKTVVLKEPSTNSFLLLAQSYQGRVMTSSADGLNGISFGWINYDIIKSGKKQEHIHAYGGEERLWLGPEGGQYSIFFAPGVNQVYDNWFVPKELDTETFQIVKQNSRSIEFQKRFKVKNYSGYLFDVEVNRSVKVLNKSETEQALSLKLDSGIRSVAYQSENSLINKGEYEWTKETGMLSLWLLSMLKSSDNAVVLMPFKKGDEKILGRIVSDDYFGKVPQNRLKVIDKTIYFKADSKHRSKIGISPLRAKEFFGSYDAVNHVLTILWCKLPENKTEFVNSKWGIQENPFSGDILNAYNDGPVENGSQLGAFYEIESSSPAANLKPNESITHKQIIFHLIGSENDLTRITEKVFGLKISTITKVLDSTN